MTWQGWFGLGSTPCTGFQVQIMMSKYGVISSSALLYWKWRRDAFLWWVKRVVPFEPTKCHRDSISACTKVVERVSIRSTNHQYRTQSLRIVRKPRAKLAYILRKVDDVSPVLYLLTFHPVNRNNGMCLCDWLQFDGTQVWELGRAVSGFHIILLTEPRRVFLTCTERIFWWFITERQCFSVTASALVPRRVAHFCFELDVKSFIDILTRRQAVPFPAPRRAALSSRRCSDEPSISCTDHRLRVRSASLFNLTSAWLGVSFPLAVFCRSASLPPKIVLSIRPSDC